MKKLQEMTKVAIMDELWLIQVKNVKNRMRRSPPMWAVRANDLIKELQGRCNFYF